MFTSYRISPGDQLDVLFQIQTWVEREEFRLAIDHTVDIKFIDAPELNQVQTILPNGDISMPYIGQLRVVGLTVVELRKRLEKLYGGILRDPEIQVSVTEFRRSIKELKADLHTAPRGLSRLVTVRPDGYTTFPLLGERRVAGRTIAEVGDELNEAYEKTLPGLHCDLFLERHSGAVIYVYGDVNNAGMYKISKPITVFEALAMAGGGQNSANMDGVIVIRRHEGKLHAAKVDALASLNLKEPSNAFFLKPDDIVYLPRGGVYQASDVMEAVQQILMFRGWGITLGADIYDRAFFTFENTNR